MQKRRAQWELTQMETGGWDEMRENNKWGRRGRIRRNTLSFRVFFCCLLISGFLTVVFLVYGIYNIERYRSDFLASNAHVLAVYAGKYNAEAEMLDKYVNNICLENEAFRILERRGLSDKTRVSAQYRLKNNLSNKAYTISRYGGLFYYDSARGELRSSFSEFYSTEEYYRMNQWLAGWLSEQAGRVREGVVCLSDENCYLRLYGSKGHYVGFFLNLERYFADMPELEENRIQLIVTDGKEEVLASMGVEVLDGEAIRRYQGRKWAYHYQYALNESDLYGNGPKLLLVSNFSRFFRFWVDVRFWMFLVVIPLLGGLLSFLVYRYFKRILVFPIDRLVQHIREIEGDEVEEGPWEEAEEFREIGRTMDEMLERIRWLQEKSYREELEKQEAQLQCYQMQIKPHFYLNCLKAMDALLENREYDSLDPFVHCLATYMRARFRSVSDQVPLGQEIETAYSYYCLMSMLHSEPILFTQEIDEQTLQLRVPVFCIQILMENALKYARREGRILQMRLLTSVVWEEDNEAYLMLRFSDNGEGYGEEQLEKWNSQETGFFREAEHVGIDNLRYRLRLLYSERAKTAFYNQPSGGAVAELFLPINEERRSECEAAGS